MGTLKAGTCGVAVLQGGYRLWTAGVAAKSRVQSNGDMKIISFIPVVRVFQFVLELLPNLLATSPSLDNSPSLPFAFILVLFLCFGWWWSWLGPTPFAIFLPLA